LKPKLVVGDVSRSADVERIVQEVRTIDILVSNAGGPPPGDLVNHPKERWLEASDLVLYSAINLTRGFIEGMKERGWGRLIYSTSVGVLQPIDNLILSNTFRAGVTAFCKTISNNYAGHGITANCVCPGYTATERLSELARKIAEASGKTADEVMSGFAASNPAGRVGKPEETAALIAFLASEKAAYITGTSIPVDGGLVKALI
jgi:3-oxoacyl-[acyl-carrier protein] reductase